MRSARGPFPVTSGGRGATVCGRGREKGPRLVLGLWFSNSSWGSSLQKQEAGRGHVEGRGGVPSGPGYVLSEELTSVPR